ncbi:MAG: AraC family transcriptional regulator [Bacteroidota bacterium]
MKPLLEDISLAKQDKSIQVFLREEDSFEPYWHYHPEIELTLILEGNGIRFVGDHVENYGPKDLVLVGSNLPHQWISSEGHPIHKALVIQFQQEIFQSFPEFRELRELVSSASLGMKFPPPDPELLSAFMKLVDQPPTLQISQLIHILYLLRQRDAQRILSSSTQFQIKANEAEQSRINEALGYMMEQLDKPLRVADMAQKCNMVPQSFCRWFKKHTGHSFISYLNQTRIQNSCQYLIHTDLSIQEIAFKVGFENVSHFNRTFKKIQNIPPTGFRKIFK